MSIKLTDEELLPAKRLADVSHWMTAEDSGAPAEPYKLYFGGILFGLWLAHLHPESLPQFLKACAEGMPEEALTVMANHAVGLDGK